MPKAKSRDKKQSRRIRNGPIPVFRKVAGTTAMVGYEVRKTIGNAIAAAFAFVIALTWNGLIKDAVDGLIARFGLSASSGYVRLFAALITTLIAVGGIWYFSRWSEKSEEVK